MSECMHVTINRYVCVCAYLCAPFVFIQFSMFCFFPSLLFMFLCSVSVVSKHSACAAHSYAHVLHTRMHICSGKSFRVVDMRRRIRTYTVCA